MCIILGICLVLIALALSYSYLPTLWHKYTDRSVVTQVSGKKQIALTFDDGPDERYTGRLLDLLSEQGISATFFVVAENALQHPDLVERMRKEGHRIGIHSYRHQNAWLLSPQHMRQDIEKSVQAMEHLGITVTDYRPPWGHLNWVTAAAAKKWGLTIVLWTVMAQDWQKKATAQTIVQKLRSRVNEGDIICLHDAGERSGGAPGGPEKTLAALRQVIPEFLKAGYTFVQVRE